jgi:tetratricopeptide (TPR) repeat protein
MSGRMQQLEKMLEREPNDPFLLYGLALEHKKGSNVPRAIELLQQVIQVDPGYCYAYYQLGQIHAANGDVPAAKRIYEQGIAAAGKKGDAHAAGEIGAALAEL